MSLSELLNLEEGGFEPFELDEYYDEYDSHQEFNLKMRYEEVEELYKYCLQPTIVEGYTNLIILFVSCSIFRVVISHARQAEMAHQLSAVIGCYMLYIFFKWHFLHVLVLTVIGYFIILVLSNSGLTRKYVTSGLIVAYLVSCEMWLVREEIWQKVRGPQMIAAMKIISIAHDLDSRSVKSVDIFEYVGYVLDLGTVVWGPWVPFVEYRAKQEGVEEGWMWAVVAMRKVALSVVFFSMSVCWLEFLVPQMSWMWLVVYRDAMAFRMSHYFVSSVSEATAVMSGFKDVEVCRPVDVELPRSLAGVVIAWNIPIHRWLKRYVFRPSLIYGAMVAIGATYSASALLHGLSPRPAAVLLSLGLLTFAEHRIRAGLANRLNACLLARACPPSCSHTHRSTTLPVHLANLFFSFLAIFHLAYLGILMDPDLDYETYLFSRWEKLGFISHWVMLCTLILSVF